MSLQIRTTPFILGMRSVPGALEIRQPRGEFKMKQQKIKMVVEQELPKVLIDQSRCFAECGIKNPEEMTRDSANLARQRALEYTGRMAEEGDRLARIEQSGPKGSIIGELALERIELANSAERNIAFIPQSRPEFEVTSSLSIDWQIEKGFIEYIPRYPQISYRPSQLEIYVQQYGKIEFHYLDEKA